MPKTQDWLFPLFTDHDAYERALEKLSDFHLYTGSRCNRQCDFCIVSGRPDGWYEPLTEAILDAALQLVPANATIKFYGGEPTIDADNIIWAFAYLREKGFHGWFTVFSNGVLADRIIRILEVDAHCDVVLNYSILHGEDAEPIPPESLSKLQEFARQNPSRIYASHAGVFPYGRGVEFVAQVGSAHIVERLHTSQEKKAESGLLTAETATTFAQKQFRMCPRCRPALRSDGLFHACPFAVESNEPHFHLGTSGETPAAQVLEHYQQFLDWIETTLEPEAQRRELHPCQICTHHLGQLPTFAER
jgi:organic radical activating enzyme